MDVIWQKYERETSFCYCLIHKNAKNGIAILILFAVMKQTNETHIIKESFIKYWGSCVSEIDLTQTYYFLCTLKLREPAGCTACNHQEIFKHSDHIGSES